MLVNKQHQNVEIITRNCSRL